MSSMDQASSCRRLAGSLRHSKNKSRSRMKARSEQSAQTSDATTSQPPSEKPFNDMQPAHYDVTRQNHCVRPQHSSHHGPFFLKANLADQIFPPQQLPSFPPCQKRNVDVGTLLHDARRTASLWIVLDNRKSLRPTLLQSEISELFVNMQYADLPEKSQLMSSTPIRARCPQSKETFESCKTLRPKVSSTNSPLCSSLLDDFGCLRRIAAVRWRDAPKGEGVP